MHSDNLPNYNLRNFGRDEAVGVHNGYLPLTQEHGGGPTRASIAQDSTHYTGGQLFVREDGVVVFIADRLLGSSDSATEMGDR